MSKRADYEAKTERLLLPILKEKGCDPVDVEYVKEGGAYYLRAYIDKPGGITIDDLEEVSRILSDRLDEEDFIQESYVLEVSSPGLGRPLKKDGDFKRALGKMIEIHLYQAIHGEKLMIGVLKSYTNQNITIEDESGKEQLIDRQTVSLVREYIEF